MIKRWVILIYGIIAYMVFLGSFLYAIGFVGNLVVPKTIDSGTVTPFDQAVWTNIVLLGLFAVSHSVMARQGFKQWWTRIIPPEAERSTYVLVSSLVLILLFWQWQPMPSIIWDTTHPMGQVVLQSLFWLGWITVLLSTFMINHFDLFGLHQVVLQLQQKPYTPLAFRTPWLYRYIRHPIMVGFIMAFWATPTMTLGHLLFAVATTAYIMVGVSLEERDLVDFYGEDYLQYKQKTAKFCPFHLFSSGFSRKEHSRNLSET